MAGPLVIGAEGVILVQDEESYGASRPIDAGIELALQLSHFPTSRVTILIAQVDTEPAEHFCRVHGLHKSSIVGIAPEDEHEDPALAQWFALERQRSAGPVNMVLTAHSEVYERCKSSFQAAILFARRGSLGEGPPSFTWNDLHDRVLRSREARADYETDESRSGAPAF